jgi:hypothetical protein
LKAGASIVQQIDHRHAGRHPVQRRLHLPDIGPVMAEIDEQDDHSASRVALAKSTRRGAGVSIRRSLVDGRPSGAHNGAVGL